MRRGVLCFLVLALFLAPVVAGDYRDPLFEITKNNIAGHSFTGFEGIDENVGTTEYVIWAENTAYVYPVAATLMNVSSSSANDANGGTGAWNVTIIGLDANYVRIVETVTLNGQTPVSTVNQFFRINRMVVQHVGTVGSNVGYIYIGTGATVAGKPTVVYNEVVPNWGTSSTAIYTVPDGYTAYIKYFHLGTDSTKIIEATLQARCLTCPDNGWRVDYHNHFPEPGPTHTLPLPFPYPEHTDIKVTARNSVGSAFVTCDMFFILVEDGYSLINENYDVTVTGGSEDLFNTPLLILSVIAMILSILFYMGERIVPWFIALVLGLLSGLILFGVGFYWLASMTVIPVYAWLFILWGTINLILFAYFSVQLNRQRAGYVEDDELYGPVS